MGLFINSITSAEMRCVCVLPSMKAKHCHAMYYRPFRGLNFGPLFREKEIKDLDIQLLNYILYDEFTYRTAFIAELKKIVLFPCHGKLPMSFAFILQDNQL